jgi:dipeptidyl aminopeptidase/acylaminoacyl peptidase
MKRLSMAFLSVTFALLFLLPLLPAAALSAVAQTSFTFAEMMKIRRVGDPQLSPDGRTVAFTIGEVNMSQNRILTQIYTMPVHGDGGAPRQITRGERSNSTPRWSPDGKKIAFTTGGQIWTMDADGDDKKQITKISTGASNPVWSPDGRWIAFVSDVYPDCATDECNQRKDAEAENNKVQAKVTDRLLFRHWNEWRHAKRTHVFVVPAGGSGDARDLTPGDFDAPPYGAASGVDYAFSPDSQEIAFLKNPDKVEAISTNSDIFIVKLSGSDGGAARNITAANKGYDVAPVYTPDGKYILFRSQKTEGFEADRWRIMRYNRQTGETVELTQGFDLQADEMILAPDGRTIYFTAGERGRSPIFSVPLEPNFRLRIATHVKPVARNGFFSNLNITPDGRSIVALSSSMTGPAEIYTVNVSSGAVTNISRVNAEMNSLKRPEEIEWTGAAGAKIHGFIVKPANFDPTKKYPLLVLIHGGPQSAWNDNWGYRWNPQVFANAGYVVFMPNPRGSTGYGQKFVDEISGDWAGKVYVDLMNGVAEILRKSAYLDRARVGAAGASYGGYMVNWILGHNNDPRVRFKALLSHAGIYNLESMAAATEELWFVNYEFKGMPWENPQMYARWSPHRFARNFNTPTLVTHGELDFRVPVGEGLQLYTALQRRGVESKLIYFPDEGHWILKPQNSEFWYGQVLEWFKKHLNP